MKSPSFVLLLVALTAPAAAQAPRSTVRIYQLPPVGPLTGSETIPIDRANAATGLSITSDALAAYVGGKFALLPPIAMSGPGLIPPGNNRICATPGSNLTLPTGAPVGSTEEVQDCAGTLTAAAPIRVYPSVDGSINEQSPYPLSVPFQAIGFRKQPSGAWQPY